MFGFLLDRYGSAGTHAQRRGVACLVTESRLEPVRTELDYIGGLFSRDISVELIQDVCPRGRHVERSPEVSEE